MTEKFVDIKANNLFDGCFNPMKVEIKMPKYDRYFTCWFTVTFRGTEHYWYLLKIIVSINNLLSNDHWRFFDSLKHCKKRLPLK